MKSKFVHYCCARLICILCYYALFKHFSCWSLSGLVIKLLNLLRPSRLKPVFSNLDWTRRSGFVLQMADVASCGKLERNTALSLLCWTNIETLFPKLETKYHTMSWNESENFLWIVLSSTSIWLFDFIFQRRMAEKLYIKGSLSIRKPSTTKTISARQNIKDRRGCDRANK